MKFIFDKLSRYFQKQWQIAVLDMDAGRWIVEPLPSNIDYLKAENANGKHILIQPKPEIASHYMLADDVKWPLIKQHHQNNGKWKPGRMVVETSKDNYQVWIHSFHPISLEDKRFWLNNLKSDPGADPNNRWGRCPGFRNRKNNYRDTNNYYPLSKLIWIDWKYRAVIPQIRKLEGLPQFFSHQPLEGGVCLPLTLSRSNYERNDESATDFAYAIALFRRGCTDQNIRDRIMIERTNWNNHQGKNRVQDYLDRTISRARKIVFNG